jgi:omega-6 fatty acid desaturase (delta-12 desaturase)
MSLVRGSVASDAEVRQAAAAFARPDGRQSALQLVTSFGPFLVGCATMHLLAPLSWLLVMVLAVPTGALLVRVFIVQHDCGHGSFFAARWANALVGRLCSLFTLTPYANWGRQHGLHHADWSNLDRTEGGSDIYSACLTVDDYLALSRWQRLLYRLPRHPLIANIVLPPLVFVLLYRVPFDTPRAWVRERRSVYLTNVGLACVFAALVALVGWRQVVLVHLPVMVVASIVGVWLFSLQHRFETARWTARSGWRYLDAALEGSSWLDLPRPLHWLTGNIGFHHVHHLNQRVPNYRLAEAHRAVQVLRPVRPLSLGRGLAATFLTLWDERRGRLVRFRDARDGSRLSTTGAKV